MWIHQMLPTSKPLRVNDYVVQGTRVTVINIHLEVYIIYYHAVKIHSKRLCHLILPERHKCTSTSYILNVDIKI